MSVSFKVKGLEELLKKLDDADGTIRKELTTAMDKSVIVVHERAGTYPPAPATSTYRRTRRLGNSWAMKVSSISGGVQGIVRNPTDYGEWVMGHETQARVHRGRWATTAKIIEEKKQKIVGFFEDAIDRVVRGWG